METVPVPADTELNTPGARSPADMDTHPGLRAMAASRWLWEPRLSASLSLSSCPLGKPAPTTPEAQLVISKRKKLVSNNCTSVPPAFLVRNKLYPQGTSRSLGSTSAIWRHLFCVCFPHMFFPAATVKYFTTLFYLFSNKSQAFISVFLYLCRAPS